MAWYNPKTWGSKHTEKAFTMTSTDAERFFSQEYSWSRKNSIFNTLTISQQEDIAKKLDLAFMCLRSIHTAFISAPLVLVDNSGGKETIIEDHPYLELFENNPALTGDELKGFYIYHLLSTGQQFFWKWMNNTKTKIIEIYPLIPSWVTINPVSGELNTNDTRRLIDSYSITPDGGDNFDLTTNEVCYSRIINPASLIYGLSPLVSGTKAISLEEKRYEYMGDALDSLKVPGPVIKTERGLTNSQKDELKARLSDKLGQNASRNMLHIGGKGVELEFINPLSEMNWKEMTNLNETRICGVLGVPPIVCGAEVGLENSPWSNTGEAWRWFYRATVSTLWTQAERAWTKSFINEPNLKYKFDRSDVAELQEDRNLSATRARELFEGGLVDRDRAREIAGEPTLGTPFGKQYASPMNIVPVDSNAKILSSTAMMHETNADMVNTDIGEMQE